MTDILNACLKTVTQGFFIRQVLTILVLTAAGFVCNLCLFKDFKASKAWALLLAFPLGLALFGIAGFTWLIFGLPFNAFTAALPIVAIPIVLLIWKRRSIAVDKSDVRDICLFFMIALAVAVICTLGLFSVTIDNDSVYYYSTYPEIIVKTGRYLKYFDTLLTDVGQTSAVLNTLPFLYGFDTTFGIQHFMNMDFMAIFTYAVFSLFTVKLPREFRLLASIFALVFMVGSEPFIFISKWVMSNVYFMEFFMIILILSLLQLGGDGFMLFILTAFLSMLRVEGVVVAAMLALCLSATDILTKKLAVVHTLPALIFQILFYAMLYVRMGVDPVYSFLDIGKAAAISLCLVALLLYILILRDRVRGLCFIRQRYGLFIILLLGLGNVLLLAVNTERYISNLLTIYRNIRLGHGWGFFGIFMLIALVLIIIDMVRGGFKDIDFIDLIWVCFILTIVASCWARGGALRMGVGDSGNRVMMETVPLTVVVIVKKCYYYVKEKA